MVERILNYELVFFGSMIKFVFGPLAGTANHLSITETAILTALGMMSTVAHVANLSPEFRHKMVWKFKRDKRLFTPRNRQLVTLWNRVGLKGVAFLTPVLFMPVVGALIAISFGGSKSRILKYMAVSAIFWGFTYAIVLRQLGNVLTKVF